MNKLVSFLLAWFAAAAIGAAQPLPLTQSQNPPSGKDDVVRLKTDLVHLHAVVTDKQGRIIDDLKKEDFELQEQGVNQNISFFSHEHIGRGPVDNTVSTGKPIEAAKPSERSFTPLRSIVLFVDVIHLSPSNLVRVKQILKQFVDERMTDQDMVLLVTSSGLSTGFDQFTQNRQLLHYLIDRITPWQPAGDSRFTPYLAAAVKRGDNDAIDVGSRIMESEDGMSMRGLPRNMVRQMVEGKAGEVLAQAEYRRKVLLSVLRAVAEGLVSLPGQRLILFLSDGFTMMDTQGGTDTFDLQGAISKAVRSGVRIYSLDAKGLQAPAEFDASRPSVSLDGRSVGLLSSYMNASEKDVQDGMNALANDTGGKFFRNTNDLKGSLQSAIDDNRDFYELAYYPSDIKDSRSFRRINVRIKNHPEYRVRAQSGYLISDYMKEDQKETTRSPQEKLFRAMAAPLPVTAIRVGATATHLEVDADAAQVSLQAWIDGSGLTYREQAGQFRIELEVATVVYDRFGKAVSTGSEMIRGGLPAEQLETIKRTGFRYTKRIAVKPGHYQVRIGVSEHGADRIGTAIAWVEVPRIDTDKLTLSNILLSEDEDGLQKRSTGAAGASISPWFGVRYFTRGTFLVYQLMIYQALSREQEAALLIQREIRKGGSVIYQSPQEPISSRLIGREKKGSSIGGKIQVGMEPGIYELRISVTDPKRKKTTQETVTFGIAR